MMTAMAVVGGRVDRSKSTCFTPGGTLLTHRSSFSNIFNTGIVSLGREKAGETMTDRTERSKRSFLVKLRPHAHPFSSESRSHFMCAATFSASSFRVRFLRLSAGGCT